MSRAMRTLSVAGLVAATFSCNPFAFDSLSDELWVAIAERDSSQTAGDFGHSVAVLPAENGKHGARVVVGVGGAGLALVTYDETGAKTDQIGANAVASGGPLAPLTDKTTPQAIVPYSATTYVVGAPAGALVARFDDTLGHGETLFKGANADEAEAGSAIAVGNLGLGSATPDVVVLARLSLIVLPGGDSSKKFSCNLKRPNVTMGTPTIGMTGLVVAPVKGNGHDQIVVANRSPDNDDRGMVLIFDATRDLDGKDCPLQHGYLTEIHPFAIALGDLDGNGKPDLVVGALGSTAHNTAAIGKVVYIADVNGDATLGTTPVGTEIPTVTGESSSTFRGSRLLIADVDGDTKNELLLADAAATVDGVQQAGLVQVFRVGGDCASAAAHGPACLVSTLFDNTPSKGDFFGRALAVAKFPDPTSKNNLLAITEKDKLWVYFRVLVTGPDLRAE